MGGQGEPILQDDVRDSGRHVPAPKCGETRRDPEEPLIFPFFPFPFGSDVVKPSHGTRVLRSRFSKGGRIEEPGQGVRPALAGEPVRGMGACAHLGQGGHRPAANEAHAIPFPRSRLAGDSEGRQEANPARVQGVPFVICPPPAVSYNIVAQRRLGDVRSPKTGPKRPFSGVLSGLNCVA